MPDIIANVLNSPIVSAIGVGIGIAAIALWLAASWWAYGDAARRTASTPAAFLAAAWIVLSTPLLLPITLGIYRFLRPEISAGDARGERLAIELSEAAAGPSCARCDTRIDADWHRCPVCTTWLAAPCLNCGRWSEIGLEICPWCGHEGQAEPGVLGQQKAAAGETPAAALMPLEPDDDQRGLRVASSSLPRSYAPSRDSLSASS